MKELKIIMDLEFYRCCLFTKKEQAVVSSSASKIHAPIKIVGAS